MNKNAQVTLETVAVIAIVAIGLMAMFNYFTASVKGGWKANADSFSGGQYNPPDKNEIIPDAGQSGDVTQGRVTFFSPKISIETGHIVGDQFIWDDRVLNQDLGDNKIESHSINWGTKGALINK